MTMGGLPVSGIGNATDFEKTVIRRLKALESTVDVLNANGGGTGSSGPAWPWYNVKDYGATGDGVTDDTTAIENAIIALTANLGGVLYFPNGVYNTTGGFFIEVNCVIFGDGGYWGNSTIECSSSSATLFTVDAASLQVNFADLYLLNTHATPTAGCAIAVGSANGPQVNLTRIVVEQFYDNLVYHSGSNWVIDNCWVGTSRRYGIFIENTFLPDQGDWGIVNTVFTGRIHNPEACIWIESSGGGRITGCKFNGTSTGYNYGIALQPRDSTTILIVTGCSIENILVNGILVSNFAGATYSQIIINGNQFGMYENSTNAAIICAADSLGDLRNFVISNNIFFSNQAPAFAVNIDKIDNMLLNGNLTDGYGALLQQTGSTNIVVT